jgi:hypothetical protein
MNLFNLGCFSAISSQFVMKVSNTGIVPLKIGELSPDMIC